MKKLTFLLLLYMSANLFGQGISFENSDFKTLLAKAKKENKLIFMDAYTTWCAPCKLMVKNVFPLKSVGDFYNANFINSKFDMEKGEGKEIAKKYTVTAFPTYLFLNGDGEVVHRVAAYYPENEFLALGKEALDPAKQMVNLRKRFDAGEKDPDFLKRFIELNMFSDLELAQKAGLRYFEGKKNLDRNDLGVLLALIRDSQSPLFNTLLQNKSEFTKLMPEQQYDQLIRQIHLAGITKKAYDKNTKVLNEQLFLTEAGKHMNAEQAREALNVFKMKMAFSNADYKTYTNTATAYYGDGSDAKFNFNELNEVAWNFFEKVDDKAALQKAILWAQQSVKKQTSSFNTDTLANLYYKVGDRKNAKMWAEKSIVLAKTEGEDYQSTQELLDKVK